MNKLFEKIYHEKKPAHPYVRQRQLVLAITVAGTLFFSTGCGEKELENPVAAVRPVKLITVEAASTLEALSYPATIEAATFRKLSFEVGGLIQELAVKEAQEVKKGELLAKLNQRDYKNQLDSAKSQFNNARDEYNRAVRLDKENAIAKNTLDLRKSQLEVATAQLDSAQKAYNDTTLRAPFDGVISKLAVEELQQVQVGTHVLSIIGSDGMHASINLPASLMATMNQRKDKNAVVFLDSIPDLSIPATFDEATLEADETSQTFAVSFRFEVPDELIILPGMSATVRLSSSSINELKQVTSLPISAILSEAGKRFVWLVDEKAMTVSKREIQVADGIGESLSVTNGLAANDVIVGAGANYLAEGMEIREWVAE